MRTWSTRSSKDIADVRSSTESMVSAETLERLDRDSTVESVLDHISECLIETQSQLPESEWLQLYSILRWQPENRRAAAIHAMRGAILKADLSWIPKLEQSARDLPEDHPLQPHLREALTDLRVRLLKRSVGLERR